MNDHQLPNPWFALLVPPLVFKGQSDWFHKTLADCFAITRFDVNVNRKQAEWTVIPVLGGDVGICWYAFLARCANEFVVFHFAKKYFPVESEIIPLIDMRDNVLLISAILTPIIWARASAVNGSFPSNL